MKLVPFILKNIIAPHGITDMSHALLNNNSKELFLINFANIVCVEAFFYPLNMTTEYDIVFFIATIIHFRNDFPNIKINNYLFPKYISSSLFIIICLILNNVIPFNIGYDFLLTYMTIIHVPNHYRENWFYIKKDVILNFLLIMISCAFFNSIYENNPTIINNVHLINVAKAIIISHIYYQEKYILKDKSRI